MKVLIIDDEQDIGFILGYELKFAGHESVCFDSAAKGQAYFSEHSDVEAIVCDFQMPKMSGLDFYHWARANNFRGPFFILTGEPTMDTKKLLDLGITDVLFKPQDLNKLASLLK